jgi:Holliday junction DNA helicase RuvA
MIARITGKIVEKRPLSIILENHGFSYEVFLPRVAMSRLDATAGPDGTVSLVTFHYHHVEPSRTIPVLIGFLSEIEREFFEQFISVSGVGPKAALKALNAPISSIAQAIDEGNIEFLRSLPGIGPQRARDIIAKLQGKVGRFGLVQDGHARSAAPAAQDVVEEATQVLVRLQYKKQEAKEMIAEALKRKPGIQDVEELLNIVYKNRIQRT